MVVGWIGRFCSEAFPKRPDHHPHHGHPSYVGRKRVILFQNREENDNIEEEGGVGTNDASMTNTTNNSDYNDSNTSTTTTTATTNSNKNSDEEDENKEGKCLPVPQQQSQ